MGQSVIGIRDTFYRDLADGYRRDKEKSFLYRYFRSKTTLRSELPYFFRSADLLLF